MTAPRRCVVLVGGHGTRMRPLTTTRPKHLLPVGGTPLLDLIVGRLVDLGVEEVALAVSVHADLVARHVEQRHGPFAGDVRCVLSPEPEPLGTGGAIITAAHQLDVSEDDPLLVVNGDLLTGHDVGAQAALLGAGAEVALHVRPVDDPSPFGTVLIEDDRVVGFSEKVPGPPGTLVNAGTYVLRAGLALQHPPGRPSSWERDLLPGIISSGVPVAAHRESAWFADVGSPAALVDASRAAVLGAARSALPRDFDPAGAVARDVQIDPTAEVTDGASVGASGRVAAGAQVGGSVLLDRVVIEEGAVVSRSVIGEGAVIRAGAVVEGSAVADGAVVENGRRLGPGSIVEAVPA